MAKNPNLILFVGAGFILTLIIWGFVGGCGTSNSALKTKPKIEPKETAAAAEIDSSAEGLMLDKTSMPIDTEKTKAKPKAGIPGKAKSAAPEPKNQAADKYIVEPGDTLWKVSKKFNVSVDKIKEANKLTSDSINIGQSLIIPSNIVTAKGPEKITKKKAVETKPVEMPAPKKENIQPAAKTTVPVVKQDTVKTESLKTEPDVTEVNKAVNVPKDNAVQEIKPSTTISEKKLVTKPGTAIYKVRENDSLWRIAQIYSTTPEHLMELNNFQKNVQLKPGQEILVPGNGNNNSQQSE